MAIESPAMSQRFAAGSMDWDRASGSYDPARALSKEGAEVWREVLRRRLAPARVVLDLGSGTGRFAGLIAAALDARVIGVEPSRGMRQRALLDAPHPSVEYAGGDARWVPLKNASVDAAWLGNVIHHVPDHPACAGELARVLRPRGVVAIMGAFPGRTDGIPGFQYIPEAKEVVERFATVEDIVAAFREAGFDYEGRRTGHLPDGPQPRGAGGARRHARGYDTRADQRRGVRAGAGGAAMGGGGGGNRAADADRDAGCARVRSRVGLVLAAGVLQTGTL